MAKSALLKSSLAKKYWMALTGLFLCLFLIGHLLGNLQLLSTGENAALHFNQYALFMTTNPAIKVLSYLTYISILFHAIDGILLAIQNQKARPVKYVMNKPEKNTIWASRNMAVLGTIILIFIVTHMVSFWARMHFDKNMPLQTVMINAGGMPQEFYLTTDGGYLPKAQVLQGAAVIKNRTEFYDATANVKIKEGYKDLYKITVAFFKDAKLGLVYTILYAISMIVLGFHLYHGFGSAFQSLGVNNPKYNGFIKNFGKAFAIIVPLLFAIIPIYIHFFIK
ncbi:succinate dehydrogenase cytochrome b subunit [Flavobacterium sp. NRK1]|uniref:succinate dehydrogenase cytochrome b subunit n=1 Tax=Flavobacterium sp. NRK1 TaxID=2954929 RepID=UPI0020932CD6|nr:succinate dehydrogenase cytochrome b subunit [Flavobacterium sp. NRK1]MCO6147424.1 succinate dehydrogenase cytochrome b subunit [Flavobacterium sp. NRK1]